MEKAKVFLLGVIMTIGLIFLIGAGDGRIGRYQMEFEGSKVLVIDTVTGDIYRTMDKPPAETRTIFKTYTIKE